MSSFFSSLWLGWLEGGLLKIEKMSFPSNESYGDTKDFEFNPLSESQKELCKRLDELHENHNLEAMPSKMFMGAIFASDKRLRNNPDWLSQAANSLREILYPFMSGERKKVPKQAMTKSSIIKERNLETEIGKMFNLLNGLAHHGNSDKSCLSKQEMESYKDKFDELILDFERVMKDALMRQADVYKRIDLILTKASKDIDESELRDLISINSNAKDYFFSKAPIGWIEWLNENGFFDLLNQEAEDKTSYSLRTPELNYLIRVVEEGGSEEEVVKIMNQVQCDQNFNPAVVDQFLYLAQKLSVEHLSKITSKIGQENWARLMNHFNQSAFSYHEIVKKLDEAGKYKNLVELAEALFSVNQTRDKNNHFQRYFDLGEIHESGIFQALAKATGEEAKEALILISKKLPLLIETKEEDKKEVFTASDPLYLGDLDFFNLEFKGGSGLRYKEDIEGLLKLFGILTEKVIANACQTEAKSIFDHFIRPLPNTQTLWRMKLFAMSRCPETFQKEIEKELNRIFNEDHYSLFLQGTEYLNTLKIVFKAWPEDEKKTYLERIFEKFKPLMEKKEESWHQEYGWEILSSIASELNEAQMRKAKKLFGKSLDSDFEPEPVKMEGTSGFVQERSSVTFKEKKYENISNILEDLKESLSPESLKKRYAEDGIFNPRSAEGLVDALRADMKERMSDYLIHAEAFLDEKIHLHYTYGFLRGVEEYLREKNKLTKADWLYLFKLFRKIKESKPFEIQAQDSWMARWHWLEKEIADILAFFLTNDYKEVFSELREESLDLIEYLLQNEDPKPEQETNEGLGLFTAAINSVRGRGFQCFVGFAYLDGELLKPEVLELYKKTIERASSSIRFVIGHYLASFYFRDKDNVCELFKFIFPKNEGQAQNFIAAWEGYLTNSVYKELADELQEDYQYFLELDSKLYQRNKDEDNIGKKIAEHLALLFFYFDDFQFTEDEKHPLLEALFSSEKIDIQKHFISFLGRRFITNTDALDAQRDKREKSLNKLSGLWETLLNLNLNPDLYSAFGFWINDDRDIFEDKWLLDKVAQTLEKADGYIERDYGLLKKLTDFAKQDSEKTLIILEEYLVKGILGEGGKRKYFRIDDEKLEIFQLLYKKNPSRTKALINKLLEKGDSNFWGLMDIVK